MQFLNLKPISEGDIYPDAFLSICKVKSTCQEVLFIIRIPTPWQRRGRGEYLLWVAVNYKRCGPVHIFQFSRLDKGISVRGMCRGERPSTRLRYDSSK